MKSIMFLAVWLIVWLIHSVEAMRFVVAPETSMEYPIKSYATQALLYDIPADAEWFRLNDYGSDTTRQNLISTSWFSKPDFFFYAAQGYYFSSKTVGPKVYDVGAWNKRPEESGIELAISNAQSVYFDFSYQTLQIDLNVTIAGVGKVKFEAYPLPYPTAEEAWNMFNTTELFTYMVMRPRQNRDGSFAVDASGILLFDYVGEAFVHSQFPFYIHEVTMPSVTYIALYSTWNGKYGYSWPQLGNGLGTGYSPYWKNQQFQPWAVVQPYANGSVPSLPTQFKGDHIVLPPIPGDRRLPLVRRNITIFNGLSIHFPLIENGCPSPRDYLPAAMEFALPSCIQLRNYVSSVRGTDYYYRSYEVVQIANNPDDKTATNWCSTFGPEYKCWLLQKRFDHVDWNWLNQVISVNFELLSTCQYSTNQRSGYLRPRLLLSKPSASNWESLSLTILDLKSFGFRVPDRPTKLINWFSYADYIEFCPWDESIALENMQWLGFNVAPMLSGHWYDPRTPYGKQYYLSKTQRENNLIFTTGQIKYGLQYSPFYRSLWETYGYCYYLKRTSYTEGDAYLQSLDLPLSLLAIEIDKYHKAIDYYITAGDGTIDIAYDGIILMRELDALTEVTNYTGCDYFGLDFEDFGQFDGFAEKIIMSHNAARQRMDSETNLQLANRMSLLFAQRLTASIKKGNPNVSIAIYDLQAFNNLGYQQIRWTHYIAADPSIISQPSHYSYQHNIKFLSERYRQEQGALRQLNGTKSVPWFTNNYAGTTQPSEHFFSLLAHLFATGHDGWNFYPSIYIDDGAIYIHMAEAISFAYQYEDIIVDGYLGHDSFGDISSAILDAVSLHGKYYVAITPSPAAERYIYSEPTVVSFSFLTNALSEINVPHLVIDLRNEKEYFFTSGQFHFNATIYKTTVMAIGPVDKISSSPTIVTISNAPTTKPTAKPSYVPSSISKLPSRSPSRIPSTIPSIKAPSRIPMRMPLKVPSKSPSKTPSSAPTKTPTKTPTKYPTRLPSRVPSKVASRIPSTSPTKKPLNMFTPLPSRPPSRQPSLVPTKKSSIAPTIRPTRLPSRSPSRSPTRSP